MTASDAYAVNQFCDKWEDTFDRNPGKYRVMRAVIECTRRGLMLERLESEARNG